MGTIVKGPRLSNSKTLQVLLYLVKNHSLPTVTSLMKMTYLIDLISIKKLGYQITDFHYKRYTYGPFDQSIYLAIDELINNQLIIPEIKYSNYGDGVEYILYKYNDGISNDFSEINQDEKTLLDSLLQDVAGYGPKALTELAYATKPMKNLGAEIGNTQGLNVSLELQV